MCLRHACLHALIRFEAALDVNLCVLAPLHCLYPSPSSPLALVLTYQACKLLRLLGLQSKQWHSGSGSSSSQRMCSAAVLHKRAVRMARVLYAPPPCSSSRYPWPAMMLVDTEDIAAQVSAMTL